MAGSERYVVRPWLDADGRHHVRWFYVQDTALGYCTSAMRERAAKADAARRNRDDRAAKKACAERAS